MIDLEDFDSRPAAEEGRWLTLRHPSTGEEIPARLLLKGVDSDAYREKHLEQRRARLEHFDKTGASRLDPAAVDEEDLERLVAVTIGWEGIARKDESKKLVDVPHSPAEVKAFYLRYPDFRVQALSFITARANFLPRSAKAYSLSRRTSSDSRDA